MAHARHRIAQIGVAEAPQHRIDVDGMPRAVEAELADQRLAALLHRPLHRGENPFVGQRLGDGDAAPEIAQIGRRAMARVEGEELAFDVRFERIGQVHPRDLRQLAHPCAALDVPLVECLYGHIERLGKGDRRHDAVDRTVGEAHPLVRPRGRGGVERLVDRGFEPRRGPHAVLAGHDVERRGDTRRLARPQSRGDDRRHARQNASPTAVVTRSAPASRSTTASPSERTAVTPVISRSVQASSVTCTV